eukprot:CAMPEP_0118961424 /NCGR_PEP_ID=MMETSP1173-20130426/107_1 /TAXON_ID=1034831 /ORGANISM="Rhizochromulina marina cf, Strain CCMP1243" /LENGTH=558 /DNA_ID=CAMNT_0006909593 /DNA_START=15 /DNA_END=1691 /DNA_ORIENTATION=-
MASRLHQKAVEQQAKLARRRREEEEARQQKEAEDMKSMFKPRSFAKKKGTSKLHADTAAMKNHRAASPPRRDSPLMRAGSGYQSRRSISPGPSPRGSRGKRASTEVSRRSLKSQASEEILSTKHTVDLQEQKNKELGVELPDVMAVARSGGLLPPPPSPRYRLAVVGFTAPGGPSVNTDKNKNGVRYDSVPIANGVVKAGAACDLFDYTPEDHDAFADKVEAYDGLIVRINPGQLSAPGTPPGSQVAFDELMMSLVAKGKPVWSSPAVQKQMGAKDALVKIKDLSCGLPDTMAYYTGEELESGFKQTCAFQPRVIKQNRGSAGEGIWLCWLEGKDYCEALGDTTLDDSDQLKLMEMNDNHVEFHTVREFLAFCVHGPGGEAGDWHSAFPGKYLEGGKEVGGQLVDQRLLPRITEGEVRMQMVKDTLFAIIHKQPTDGGMSAVGGIAKYAFYQPEAPEFTELRLKFQQDIPSIMSAMGLRGEPLPVLWTADFIPVDGHVAPYVVGEFNCSCVGISKFGAACGPDKDLGDVEDEDFDEGTRLTDLIGLKAVETLDEMHSS